MTAASRVHAVTRRRDEAFAVRTSICDASEARVKLASARHLTCAPESVDEDSGGSLAGGYVDDSSRRISEQTGSVWPLL